MPSPRTYPVAATALANDRLVIRALKNLPGFTPTRPEHTAEALEQADDEIKRLSRARDLSWRCTPIPSARGPE